MPVVLKISFNEDIRRVKLEQACFAELERMVKTMFGMSNTLLKYQDDEGDLVTVTSDVELQEAIAASKTILRMFVSERAKPASVDKGKGKESEKPTNVPPSNTSSSDPSPFGDFIQYLNPDTLLATVSVTPDTIGDVLSPLKKLGVSPATDKSLNDLAASAPWLQRILGGLRGEEAPKDPSSSASSSESESESVHNGVTCDECGQSPIVGTRYKCGECFNYDLCDACEHKGIHDPSHPRVKMTKPRQAPFSRLPSIARYRPRPSKCGSPSVHAGVICDGCQQAPIIGERYKCTVCPDYDLCGKCQAKAGVHDASHKLELIKPTRSGWCHPSVVPTGKGCPYRNAVNKDSDASHEKYVGTMVSVSGEDDVTLAAGGSISKVWKVRNDGEVAWPENTTLSFVYGDNLTAPSSLLVGPVGAGQEVEIAADLTAPSAPGKYSSYWRLCCADKIFFGPPFWVRVTVEPIPVRSEDPAPVPVPVEAPAPIEAAPIVVVEEKVEIPVVVVEEEEEEEVEIPVVDEPFMTDAERAAVMTIQGMGFGGDILEVLRINDGDVQSTVNALLG